MVSMAGMTGVRRVGCVLAAMHGHFGAGLLVHLVNRVRAMVGVVMVLVVLRWHLVHCMVAMVVVSMMLVLVMLCHNLLLIPPPWEGISVNEYNIAAQRML
jgi:hypothetical protein